MKIKVLDSTLRDGCQGEGISYTLSDKLKIIKLLDKLGVDYIEAGNPAASKNDLELFLKAKELKLEHSKLVAFGSTRRKNIKPEQDQNLNDILNAKTSDVVIFGKSSAFHVEKILKTSLDENLSMIEDSISFLTKNNVNVMYDAEHFFDGYKYNKDYAIKTLIAAKNAGATTIVLCDTNGGSFPDEVFEIVSEIKEILNTEIGIHCHNDNGLAVANTLLAVKAGALHIQGTIAGFGERCGNANLSTVIPDLQIKLKHKLLKDSRIELLTPIVREICEISNINLSSSNPFVGTSAFAHKAGMHLDGVIKNSDSFEHIKPELVGNKRRYLISELSGKAAILSIIDKIYTKPKTDIDIKSLLDTIKNLEQKGYQFEAAEGSLELVIKKQLGDYKPFFTVENFNLLSNHYENSRSITTATIKIRVDNKTEISAAEGEGPVHAIDNALRKTLEVFYPVIKELQLIDYKVRVIENGATTSSKVRVLIETTDINNRWNTIGVSKDIIKASLKALVDAYELKLCNYFWKE